ncbi:helix-turn-helix transcriptional regulator [Acinetobacter larvae]|uniref:Transcriptional regulator n=1 Tax=Acinetobacter larvae TaxID=1789224 RepID=A0A1B2LWM1_9GAMM|nr:helix-turn-helix transcriptional regulator [Acinetobacter larvae]AOA57324.1 transcriptional regulator [Acinetobacter larvae]
MQNRRQRVRPELADFLQRKRASLCPEAFGIARHARRRAPGLRREEVAALAGVGVSWYTWLEQGRDIGVSSQLLDRLAQVLQMNYAEREHLYLLTQMRVPLETGDTEHDVPHLIQRMLLDLPANYLCYVLNLHWDVLAFNAKADQYFQFSSTTLAERNFLWQLFDNPLYQERLFDWSQDAEQLLSSFRRDFVRVKQHAQIQHMIASLNQRSATFRQLWAQHDIYQPCTGQRRLRYCNQVEQYAYTSLTFDLEKHRRLIVYAPSF